MKQKMSPSQGIAKAFAKRSERKIAKKILHKKTRQSNTMVCKGLLEEVDVAPKWIW